jgi:hypothetical protein
MPMYQKGTVISRPKASECPKLVPDNGQLRPCDILPMTCLLRLRRGYSNCVGDNVLKKRNYYLHYPVSIQCLQEALNNGTRMVSSKNFCPMSQVKLPQIFSVVGLRAKKSPCRQPRLNCRRHISASFPYNCR